MAAGNDLKAFVERIERIEAEITDLNGDKRDIYAEAKSSGFDVKVLKAVIARRRKDPAELNEHDALVEIYLAAIESGTVPATRVRAHETPPEPATADDGIPAFLDRRGAA